ncbi:MAG TPA: hypothetical protein DCG67_18115 [Pseudomonas sp.]|nr:hypothetical protein [Pseudomonas sp.]
MVMAEVLVGWKTATGLFHHGLSQVENAARFSTLPRRRAVGWKTTAGLFHAFFHVFSRALAHAPDRHAPR